MATQRETVEFILDKLGDRTRFTVRAMFGEFALYADKKVVALVCNDLLYVKMMPESESLQPSCDVGEPYPGAKPYYVVSESSLSHLTALPRILIAMAAALPTKKTL